MHAHTQYIQTIFTHLWSSLKKMTTIFHIQYNQPENTQKMCSTKNNTRIKIYLKTT